MIVIGGGLAGLAAGVALADSGWRVRLFEQRPFLGGRATSYVLPDGEHVDNCQHVTFGCCTNLEDFCARVGSANKIKFFDRLVLVDPQGNTGQFQAGFLPAPLHILGSFVSFRPLTLADKLAVARAMLDIVLHRGKPPDLQQGAPISMLDWLQRRRQPPRAIERFWRAVLVSALSEELDKIDARYGIDVFWKTVLCNRTGYRMGVPVVPLADMYETCRSAMERQGGEVHFRAPARLLRIENGSMAGVQFDAERLETADAYVIAVPHAEFRELLPPELQAAHPEFQKLNNLRDAPITGIHLWFDRPVMQEPFLTLLDTTTQWIFNKSALYGASNGASPKKSPNGQYLQLVVSASYDLLPKGRQEIIDLCLKEVRHALPAARDANLIKATVIKEAAATFSPEPGVDRWRLKQETSVRGLFLAGDWTDTGWPATMEGAVRSGYLAAEAILKAAGAPRRFLRPDLPPDGLMALWAGNSSTPGHLE